MNTAYHIDHYYTPPRRLGEIDLVQLGRLFCSRETVVEKHLHLNWFELTIATDGKGMLYTNGEQIPVGRGDVYLSFPADEHAIFPDRDHPLKYDFLSFYPANDAVLERFEALMLAFQAPAARKFSDEKISALVENAIAEVGEREDDSSEEVLSCILRLIVVYLLRDFDRAGGGEKTLNPKQAELFCYQLMNYIDTHIFTLQNLNELAEVTGYTYSYISRLFRHATGRTLLDYYKSSRLKKADLLIRQGELKIGEIAETLNYSTIYAFSKAYKNFFGHSPRRK